MDVDSTGSTRAAEKPNCVVSARVAFSPGFGDGVVSCLTDTEVVTGMESRGAPGGTVGGVVVGLCALGRHGWG